MAGSHGGKRVSESLTVDSSARTVRSRDLPALARQLLTEDAIKMLVTICSKIPSNDPEIHAAGCADIARNKSRGVYEHDSYDQNAASRVEVSSEYWADIIAELEDDEQDGAAERYLSEFKFFPCTKGLA